MFGQKCCRATAESQRLITICRPVSWLENAFRTSWRRLIGFACDALNSAVSHAHPQAQLIDKYRYSIQPVESI
jgi:hypothetical protein